MKKSLSVLFVVTLCVLCAGTSFSQATANQTVNLAVNSVQKIAITGSPITLTIVNGVAGTDALTPVTDATSTYSITHNSNTALRITANLDAVLASGYQLQMNLAPSVGHGTSAGTVDISNALAASANQLESIRAQVAALEKELGSDDTGKAIRKAADELADKLTTVENKVLQLKATGRGQDDVRWPPMLVQKIVYLADEVGSSSDFAPTTQQVAVAEQLKQQGEQFEQEYQQILAKDLGPFNAMLREKNIPNIITKAP